MAPLFSKADLNKFSHDVQNEVTLICAKFGKDLFSISKVMGHKTTIAHPSICTAVCLSHGWISRKRLKLGL